MKKVLFISHDANRAGAQLLLLNYLKWLKGTLPDLDIHILLMGSGELLCDFKEYDNLYIYPKNYFAQKWFLLKFKIKILLKFYDLIYSNTVMNQEILNELDSFNTPIIVHVHELAYWIGKSRFTPKSNYHYIAASNAVKNYLIDYFEIKNEKIDVIYEYINVNNLINQTKKSLSNLLKLPNDSIYIGACGIESYRKGKDFFVTIAEKVLVENKNIHFVWFGGELDEEIKKLWNNSIYKNNIHFLKSIPNVSQYFSDLTLFLMLSREDPFPTVNLEVGIYGVPIVCFKNSGGTEELIKNDAGVVIENYDTTKLSEAIINLIDNTDQMKKFGENLKNRVISYFDINQRGKEINDLCMKLIISKSSFK